MVKLILVRHGQSVWNLENKFTGWADVPLSKKGIKEAKQAGVLLEKFKFDSIYTSVLIRANMTLFEILNQNKTNNIYFQEHESKNYNKSILKNNKLKYTPIKFNEALNERHYGKLEGFNKDEMRKKFGEEQIHIWRRSFDIAPPNGESLKDTLKRTIPYFKKKILKDLKQNKTTLIVAHGNSLRSIVKHIEDLNNEEIMKVEIPTGTPIVYNLDEKNDFKVKSKKVLK